MKKMFSFFMVLLLIAMTAKASVVPTHVDEMHHFSFSLPNADDYEIVTRHSDFGDDFTHLTLRAKPGLSDVLGMPGHELVASFHHLAAESDASLLHFVRLYHAIGEAQKMPPVGENKLLSVQSTSVDGHEAVLVQGASSMVNMSMVHIKRGNLVWFVWTNANEQSAPAAFKVFMAAVKSFKFDATLTPSTFAGVKILKPDVLGASHWLLANSAEPYVLETRRVEMARSLDTRGSCSQCCPNGCNFGTQYSSFWCQCCRDNCGGLLQTCRNMGYDSHCSGGNNGGGGSGTFSQCVSPYPNSNGMCGSWLHTGNANWAIDQQYRGNDGAIRNSCAGTASCSYSQWGYGRICLVTGPGNYASAYAHLNSYSGSGWKNAGDYIGQMGTSGGSCNCDTGVPLHLHYHVRDASNNGVNLNQMPFFHAVSWPTSGTANCAGSCYPCCTFN